MQLVRHFNHTCPTTHPRTNLPTYPAACLPACLQTGDPLDSATDMGPLVSEKQLKKVMDYIERGKKEGEWRGVCVCGGPGGWQEGRVAGGRVRGKREGAWQGEGATV